MSERREIREGLCFRCEHRAMFLERGWRPRHECGNIEETKYGCYMYRPVRPVITEVNEGDDRPQFAGSMLSARAHFHRVMDDKEDIGLKAVEFEDGSVGLLWDKMTEDEKLQKP